MTNNIKGKIVVNTGASSGLGEVAYESGFLIAY